LSYPSPGKAWWVVFVLLCCYTLSFIDRQILALMVGPIREDLNINDFWFSQLTGTAFAVLYSFLGIPIGILADRANRKRIIAVGIAIWSIMTALCGTARTFGTLFLFRIGVGIGEAALSPCAYSIVADSFPKEARAKPMGAYSMGTYVGAGLAMIFGGIIVQYIIGLGPVSWPVVGELRPWQAIFFLVALPAIPVLLLLLLTIREPKRQDVVKPASETSASEAFKVTVAYMKERWDLYLTIILGITILALISYAAFSWYIEFFIRIHHWSRQQAGMTFGLIVLFCGAGGMFSAGAISDYLLSKGVKEAPIRTARYSAMVLIIPLIVAPLVSNPWVTVALLVPGTFALGFHVGLGPSALQHITPNHMRGQVIAIYLLLLNLIAQIVGQSLPGWMTSYVFHDDLSLGKALSITCGGAAVVAIIILTIAGRKMRAYEEAQGH
jgi:MFS family permease